MTLVAPFSSSMRLGRQAASGLALAGPRLRLRPMASSDVERIYEANRGLNHHYLASPPLDQEKLEELRQKFEDEWYRYGLGYLMVCHDDETIGHVRLKNIAHRTSSRAADLTFATDPAHREKGYATEAVGVVVADAFERAGMDYVVACVDPDNEAAARVVEKNGFAWVSTGKMHGRVMRRYILPLAMWRAQRRAMGVLPSPIATDL